MIRLLWLTGDASGTVGDDGTEGPARCGACTRLTGRVSTVTPQSRPWSRRAQNPLDLDRFRSAVKTITPRPSPERIRDCLRGGHSNAGILSDPWRAVNRLQAVELLNEQSDTDALSLDPS